jgi:hypothetical protein
MEDRSGKHDWKRLAIQMERKPLIVGNRQSGQHERIQWNGWGWSNRRGQWRQWSTLLAAIGPVAGLYRRQRRRFLLRMCLFNRDFDGFGWQNVDVIAAGRAADCGRKQARQHREENASRAWAKRKWQTLWQDCYLWRT